MLKTTPRSGKKYRGRRETKITQGDRKHAADLLHLIEAAGGLELKFPGQPTGVLKGGKRVKSS